MFFIAKLQGSEEGKLWPYIVYWKYLRNFTCFWWKWNNLWFCDPWSLILTMFVAWLSKWLLQINLVFSLIEEESHLIYLAIWWPHFTEFGTTPLMTYGLLKFTFSLAFDADSWLTGKYRSNCLLRGNLSKAKLLGKTTQRALKEKP